MKKSILVLIVLMTLKMTAQSFTEINEGTFVGVFYPSIAITNINEDVDNTPEIIINGNNEESAWTANVYAQDANGDYFDVTTEGAFNFIDAINSRVVLAFADIDNDGDQDLLITGYETKLYRNTGLGLYEEISTDIKDVKQGATAFFDIDNDNDLDLLITGTHTGVNGTGNPATFLYVNDGTGNFIEDTNTSFYDLANSTISVADIDGDNDLDLLLTGSVYSNDGHSKLYTNNGTGVFTEVVDTPFEGIYEGVSQGSSAFADIDGDQDLFITGRNWQSHPVGKLYTNDGSGVFTEVSNTGLAPVQESSIAFADVDGDDDFDLMITGLSNGPSISKLYTNDGSGNFTEVANLPFDGFLRSALQFFDADGDNDLDLIIAGFSITDNTYRTKLYRNTTVLGVTEFTEISKSIIYPNPVQDTFTLQLPEEFVNTSALIEFNLYDSIGRKVVSIPNFSSENNLINIQNLESGLYFYEVINNNRKIGSGKVIKQ